MHPDQFALATRSRATTGLFASVFACLPAQEPQAPAPGALPQAAAEPMVALFDGKTLDGWTTTGGRYDGPARWTVEDGCLVGRTTEKGEGGLLYTARDYHGFDLEFDVRMDYPFDSGVFLRMVPPATRKRGLQVTLDHRPGGEIGAVYADGFLQHNEQGAAAYRQGEWNHVRVRAQGRRCKLQAWVNGTQVTDFVLPEDIGDFAESGRIGLQVHGGEPSKSAVRFKNILLREYGVFDADTFAPEPGGRLRALAPEWIDLLAGTGLQHFVPHGGDGSGFVQSDDGTLALRTEGQAHELRSKEDFADFELRLEFKLARLADSGVFLRATRDDSNPSFSGCEIQLLDDRDWEKGTNSKLKPWQFTGSLYGAVAPQVQNAPYPTGCWNTLEVLYRGTRIRTRLNGWTLYDVDTKDLQPEQGAPFTERAPTGFLGLQRHAPGGAVQAESYAHFRNMFVRRLR